MIRSSVFVLALVLAGLAGCATEDVSVSPAELHLRAFEAQGEDAARATYQWLSDEERAELWAAHLDRMLATGRLNAAQAAMVRDVRRDVQAAFASAADVEARARAVMNEREMKAVFGRVGEMAPTRPVLSNMAPACNSASCTAGCVCVTDSCPICPGSVTRCYQESCIAACQSSSWGCGFLWVSSCTILGASVGVSACDYW